MTKKHFLAIAEALRKSRPPIEDGVDAAYARWLDLVEDIAAICAAENPAFRRLVFLSACGL